MSTVMRWLAKAEHEEFREQYAHAREVQAEVRADEIVDIADATEGGSNEAVQSARLRVDSRKWIASKLLPKKYGDKIQHTGDGGGPVVLDLEPILTKALKTAREHEQRIASEADDET